MSTLSRTDRLGKSCATWNERRMPRRVTSRGGMRVISTPRNRMTPSSGLRYPVTMLMKVVLPAPLAPMMPTVSPFAISTVTLSAATTARSAC